MIQVLFMVTLATTALAGTWTKSLCRPKYCDPKSTPGAGYGRAIGNKADNSFSGYLDVWANDHANYFTTNIKVDSGQAWPRIYEGLTHPETGAGYPVSVNHYTSSSTPTKYISYSGKWTARTNGDGPGRSPSGGLQNGAYIWFNDPNDSRKWKGGKVASLDPQFPYTIEVNIWNKHTGTPYRSGADRFRDYHDSDGSYEVRGHYTGHDGDRFYAYYVTLARTNGPASMTINLKTLLSHLRDHTWANADTPPALKGHYLLIETSIAAEGHSGGDGKFEASINTMGRP